jgi:malonate transporter
VVAVLEGFALIAAIVAVGWLLGHSGLFGRREERMLARLTFYVGSPSLLFLVVSRADVRVIFSGFLVATVIAVAVCSVAYLLIARLVFHRRWAQSVMGGMAASYANSNNLGLPIAIYVLGDATWAAPLLLMQLLLLQPAWLAALRSPFTNPLTISTLLGLGFALAGRQLPDPVLAPVEILGGLAIPCMLIAFGISLRLSPVPGGRGNRAEIATVVLIKLLLMPAVAWLVAGPVLGLSTAEVMAVVVMASLPTAQNVYVLSVAYGRSEDLARDTVFLTTVLALPAMLGVVALLG